MTAARRTPPPRRPPAVTWMDASWRWADDGALVLTLPVPESANRQWRAGGGRGRGRTYKTKAARDYEVSARWALASCPRIGGDVAVEIVWYRARRVGDVDNRLKLLLDALKNVAFGDDAAVARLSIVRMDTDLLAACVVVAIRAAAAS